MQAYPLNSAQILGYRQKFRKRWEANCIFLIYCVNLIHFTYLNDEYMNGGQKLQITPDAV